MMSSRLCTWLPVLLSLAVLALSCGDGGAPVGQGPRTLTANEEKLRSMVLATEEVGEVFPELAWSQFESGGPQAELIPEDERAAGLVASWIAVFGPGAEEGVAEVEDQVVTTDLFLYETADNASVAIEDELERLIQEGAEINGFDAGDIGDEAQSVVTRNPGGRVGTGVFMRVDGVLAFIRLIRSDDEEMSEEALRLAQKQAEKIEAIIQG